MKRFFTVLLSVTMAVLTASILPLRTFAVGESAGRYIGALSIAYGRDEMKDNGFTIIDRDLNSGTTKGDVFLGYKATNDPKLGITDIKAIQEKNGYTIFDADEVLSNIQGDALEDAIYFMKAVREFRENYKTGQKFAVLAYNMMQLYRYSEAQLLGDFIVDPSVDANMLSEIVLKAAPEMSNGLYALVLVGLIDDDNNTFLANLADVDIEDYDEDSVTKGRARDMLAAIKSYQVYIDSNIHALASETEGGETEADSSILMVSDLLGQYPIGDTNVFMYIMDEDLTAKDLYPLATIISDTEIQMMKLLGFEQFILSQSWGITGIDSYKIGEKSETYEPVDFWEGSTNQLGGRIAITNDLLQQTVTGNYSQSFASLFFSSTKNLVAVTSIGVTTFFMGCSIAVYQSCVASAAVATSTTVGEIGVQIAGLSSKYGLSISGGARTFQTLFTTTRIWSANLASDVTLAFNSLSGSGRAMVSTMGVSGLAKAGTAVSNARAAVQVASKTMSFSIVLTVVAILICVIFFVIDLVNYYNPDYSECPAVVLSEETLSDGSKGYVTYYSVNYGTGSGPADTNGREGKAWNALYYTTSSAMGAPIRAGSIEVTHLDSDRGGRDYAVTLFGVNKPYDLNTNAYTHNHGVYMFFDRVDENTLASVFTTPNIIIMCSAAVLIVAAAVVVIVTKHRKKTATVSESAEENTD